MARRIYLYCLTVPWLLPHAAFAQAETAEQQPTLQMAPAEEAADGGMSRQEEEARALFIAGRAAFERGEFEPALDHFRRAYELSERPGLLFNIGNTYDRMRQDEQALDYLSRYLEAVPDAENRDFVASRLERLRANLSEQEAVEADRERLAEENRSVDATASDVGIALMIGGGVAILGMIGPAAYWADTDAQLSRCPMCPDPRRLNNNQKTAIGLTLTLAGLGGVAMIGGGLLYALFQPEDSSEAHATCIPSLNGVACMGQF